MTYRKAGVAANWGPADSNSVLPQREWYCNSNATAGWGLSEYQQDQGPGQYSRAGVPASGCGLRCGYRQQDSSSGESGVRQQRGAVAGGHQQDVRHRHARSGSGGRFRQAVLTGGNRVYPVVWGKERRQERRGGVGISLSASSGAE